jgi:hypothetical protein
MMIMMMIVCGNGSVPCGNEYAHNNRVIVGNGVFCAVRAEELS